MKVNWVLADDAVLDPAIQLDQLKDIGSLWGSWRGWRAYQTDNVICNELRKASELLQRQFNQLCNLYISNENYVLLDSPDRVRLYEGKFVHDLDHQDEIIALHLAASQSDIVLLLGFDWQQQPKHTDRLQEHRNINYRQLVKHVIMDNPDVQWVLVDHAPELTPELANLENLTQDTLENVIELLKP
jgi:hypothetical protein